MAFGLLRKTEEMSDGGRRLYIKLRDKTPLNVGRTETSAAGAGAD